MVYPLARHITAVTSFNRFRVRSCAALVPAKCREPLCPQAGVTSCSVTSCITSEGITPPSSLIWAHAPNQIPPSAFSFSLGRRVFAGCCQPLLGDDPSRHYLCNPCVGAWTPTPQCPSGALARFFPEDNGFTSDVTSSAHQKTPTMQLQPGISFRGCSHSITFRLPRSLDPQVAPTASHYVMGSRAVYTTHSSVG